MKTPFKSTVVALFSACYVHPVGFHEHTYMPSHMVRMLVHTHSKTFAGRTHVCAHPCCDAGCPDTLMVVTPVAPCYYRCHPDTPPSGMMLRLKISSPFQKAFCDLMITSLELVKFHPHSFVVACRLRGRQHFS